MINKIVTERKLSVQVVGSKDQSEETKEDVEKETNLRYHAGEGLIDDTTKFRSQLKMHPVLFITK